MKTTCYTGSLKAYRMFAGHIIFKLLLRSLFLIMIFYTLPGYAVKAQPMPPVEGELASSNLDEIPVHVIAQGINNFDVDAIITKDNQLFVNIKYLFNALNIPCVIGQNGNSLSGFIENENQTYLIDFITNKIKAGSKTVNTRNGLIKEMGNLYMESSIFAEAFGLTLTFNYRTLSVILKSDFELPVIKLQRIEKLRSNVLKVKGEEIADTVLQRNYHLFKTGTLDWSAASSQTLNGPTENHVGLGIGTEFLYGEADISVNYNDRQKFDNRQLQYIWRWVDNDKSIIKQAQVGTISNQTISYLNSPIIGAVIRNSPTTIRKATGYYNINEFTEPNWNVELYINNVLVDFTKADASGLYNFKVPIVYGYTTLKFKFYGPMGEERTEERTMNVPYTVMPAHELEYSLSGGIVQDSLSSRFGKSEFHYGVNRFFTLGGGLEYLSSIPNGAFIPYLTTTIQPFSKLTLNGEYAYNVKYRGLLEYYLGKNALLVIDYAKFAEGQLATRFNASEERKVKLSFPLKYKKMTGFAKFDYTQLVYKAFNFNQAGIIFSTYYKQISANSSTQLNWIDQKNPYVTSDLAISYRMKKGITIRPSAQYNFSQGNLMTCNLVIEKYIPRGNFSISYQRNVQFNDNLVSINFKYDLPFARTNVSVSHSKGNTNISEGAQGSFAFGSGNHHTQVSNNSSISKGGISLYPFLDLNHNGIFDAGEHMVKLTSIKMTGGKVIFSEKDSIVRISDLNPFTKYLIEFNNNQLENIAWRFKKNVYQVLVDPNQFKRIDIPINSVGEVSGMTYMNTDNELKGIARILVKFYDKNSNREIAETISESDGYIYYLGLNPGDYIARIDSEQLKNLEMVSSPEQIPIKISQSFDGDIVRGLDFTLVNKIQVLNTAIILTQAKPVAINSVSQVKPVAIDSVPQVFTGNKTPELINNKRSILGESYVMPTGDLQTKSNAINTQKVLMKYTDKPVSIMNKNGIYKLWISGLSGEAEYDSIIAKLTKTKFHKEYSAYLQNSDNKISPEKNILDTTYSTAIQAGASVHQRKAIRAGRIFLDTTYSAVIQVGAFVEQRNAIRAERKLVNIIDHPITIIFEDGFYKVQINGFTGRIEAIEFITKLNKIGFTETWVVRKTALKKN